MSTEKNIRNIESDLEFENQIRPRELDNFAGQEKIVDNACTVESHFRTGAR